MAGRVLYVASLGNWRGRRPLSACIDEVGLSRRTYSVRLFRADIWGNKAVFAEVQERNSFICWPIVHPYTERSVPQNSACLYYINRYSTMSSVCFCCMQGDRRAYTFHLSRKCAVKGEGRKGGCRNTV